MLGWFHRLLPREEKFFDLFDRHSQTVVAGAQALRAMLDGGEGLERHFKEVMDRENEADDITREVDEFRPDVVYIDGFYFMRDRISRKSAGVV